MRSYTFQIGVLITAGYLLLVALFLLASYTPSLVRFFLFRQKAALSPIREFSGRTVDLLKVVGLLLVCGSFILTTSFAYQVCKRQKVQPAHREFPLLNEPGAIITQDNRSNKK
jgi:hypothetical protein